LPQVAAVEVAGDGRNSWVTAEAIRVWERKHGERGVAELTIWVGLTDPAGRLGFWSGLSGLG
jgi:hypothetical protein